MSKRIFTQTFGVAGAIIEKDGKVLLVKEGEDKVDAGKWNQPAGWIDVGENPVEAAKREVKEETGLDFEPTGLIGVYSLYRKDMQEKIGATLHALKFIFRGKFSGELKYDGKEISELRWFAPDEIEKMELNELRDFDIKKEVADYFAGKSYPLEIIRHTTSE